MYDDDILGGADSRMRNLDRYSFLYWWTFSYDLYAEYDDFFIMPFCRETVLSISLLGAQ